MISERIENIGLSPTMEIAAKAIAMKAEGVDLVDLSVGEPDFPTPGFIKEAAIKAINQNLTRYTLNQGIVQLREAISRKLIHDNNLEYTPDEIIVSNGAKHSIFNIIQSVIGPGNEVIIPAPYWVSYPEMVKLAGGKPVIVQTREENGFKLTGSQLRETITAHTRALIICNPCNPTGAAYTHADLEELGKILEREELYIISDEVYEKLVYDGLKFVSFASLGARIKKKTVLVNGVSKAYAMTGWRIGYAAGPREIIEAANKFQGHSTSNASTISQYAALAALNGPATEIEQMRQEFEKRRNYMLQRMTSFAGLTCTKPHGAFYVFPNVSRYFNKIYNDQAISHSVGLSRYLLYEALVATIAGSGFGTENYLRISYTNTMDQLEKGMDRIQRALEKLES